MPDRCRKSLRSFASLTCRLLSATSVYCRMVADKRALAQGDFGSNLFPGKAFKDKN